MIVFDLRCAHDHVFEAWFASGAAYEEQRGRGLLVCPVCGDAGIGKAVMAPNIAAKSNALAPRPAGRPGKFHRDAAPAAVAEKPTPEVLKAALQALAAAQKQVLEKSQWVGTAFADRARAMHAGDLPSAPIHGQTTRAEAKSLAEEGVPVAPLPFPIVPPEAIN